MKKETCYYVFVDADQIYQTTDRAKARQMFDEGRKVAELESFFLSEDGDDNVSIVVTRVWKREN